MKDMKKAIVAMISNLEATVQTGYRIFVTVPREVVHLYGF